MKRLLKLTLCLALLAALFTLAAAAAYADETITASTTWTDGSEISGTVNVSGGTESNPIVITVQGTVTMADGAGINIASGTYLNIVGQGSDPKIVVTGTSSSAIRFDSASGGFGLTLEDLTFDGGVVDESKTRYLIQFNDSPLRGVA